MQARTVNDARAWGNRHVDPDVVNLVFEDNDRSVPDYRPADRVHGCSNDGIGAVQRLRNSAINPPGKVCRIAGLGRLGSRIFEVNLALDQGHHALAEGVERMAVEDGQIAVLANFKTPDALVDLQLPGRVQRHQAQGLILAKPAPLDALGGLLPEVTHAAG